MMSKADAVQSGFTIAGSCADCVPFGGIVCGLLQCIGETTALVVTLFENMKQNIESCKEIMSSVHEIEEMLKQLKEHYQKELPQSIQLALCRLRDSKTKINIRCHYILNKGKPGHLLKANKHAKELEGISKELKEAKKYLQQTLSTLQLQLLHDIKTDVTDLGNQLLNPLDGIVINDKNYTALNPPSQVSATLNDQKNAMIVTWIDEKNEKDNIVKYEVMINPYTKQNIPFLVENLKPQEIDTGVNTTIKPLKYSVCIFPPVVMERQFCEIQIRAVNGVGPSEWSEMLPFKFLTGRPETPKITSIKATSPNEVEIKFVVKQEESQPISECHIEYGDVEDHKVTGFTTATCSEFTPNKYDPNIIEGNFTASELKNNTRYLFKVKANTAAGSSSLSKSEEVNTNSFLPGPPVKFKVLQPYSKDSITFMWGEPAHNASGLHRYRIRHMKRTKGEWIDQGVTLDGSQKNHRIENLKPGTSYFICFESVNEMGGSTPSSLIVVTKSRLPWSNKSHKPLKPTQIDVLMADLTVTSSIEADSTVDDAREEEIISSEPYEETVLTYDYENNSYSCIYSEDENFESDTSYESESDNEDSDNLITS